MKRTTLLCAMGISLLALTGTASAAQTGAGAAAAQFDANKSKILNLNLKANTAMTDLGAVGLSQAKALKTRFGRIDAVSTTRTGLQLMINNVRAAYRSGLPMESGYKVTGYAYLDQQRTWTVTLVKNGFRQVIELAPTSTGTRIQYWAWRHVEPNTP